MHEYGLAVGVVTAVTQQLPGRRITAVCVHVGARSGVEPFALKNCWPLATENTPVEGAELIIEQIPATVFCPDCGEEKTIDEFFDYSCPDCGDIIVEITKGQEFSIAYCDVD
ncbi:hydrogenase maturation nickel metallochaperone HypA [Corynebacterium aquilae]|uniref:Hydrogenase maturation factor HypA n=1 Tax=Corynebacterium aquilae DSM 44791 TaxID=1431546 RepID=A0A1L7CDU8_9CORY|nr:hydrogenase maturation nickel metallochaperone HypA [Corynebacterium aquilae]APT84021.1 hypothetical protein CAQU_01855 [Corynebacterium aquilae DSM 44791]